MQAPPTTSSGAPAKEPGQRPCPGCGAANGAVAAFCWQCYRPFGLASEPEAAAIYRQAGLRSTLPEPAVVTAPPGPSGRRVGAPGAVLVVLAAAAAGWFLFLRGGPEAELPEAFGGLTRVEGAQADLARDEFLAEAEREGGRGDVGLYGTAGVPSAALVWVIDETVSNTDEAFAAFAEGANSAVAGSIDPTRRSNEVVGGVQYVCASTGTTPSAAICIWVQDDVFWILADLTGTGRMADTQVLAVAAHDAVAAAA
jgi:hypothetical protein